MAKNNAVSPMDMACQERAELAELLAALTEEQWHQPSLCEGWLVRDVVAHMLGYDELSHWQLFKRFARGGFVPARVNKLGVAEFSGRSPRELCELARRCIRPRGLTAGFGGMIALSDGMIHQQDIRRPLGLPRVIEPHRLCAVLNFALTSPAIRGAKRVRGVRLVASDLDWSHGEGPEVQGPAEALLMAMAARPDALNDLCGPGKPALSGRIHG